MRIGELASGGVALRFSLALALAAAGSLKIAGAGEPARPFEFAPILGALEILLAAWLLSGWAPSLGRGTATFGFAAFGGVALTAILRGDRSCGCFGDVRVPPSAMLAFDAAAVASLVLGFGARRPRARGGAALPSAALVVCGAAVGSIAGMTGVFSAASPLRVLDPPSWIGKPFPLSDFVSGAGDLSSGAWRVVFFRVDCSHCRKSAPGWARVAGRTDEDGSDRGRMAFVEVPPFGDRPRDLFPAALDADFGRLDVPDGTFVRVPFMIRLSNGIVTHVDDAAVAERPSPSVGAASGLGPPGSAEAPAVAPNGAPAEERNRVR